MEKEKKQHGIVILLKVIFLGVLLFFALNLIGTVLKEPIRLLLGSVDTSSPINLSLLAVIPISILGGSLFSVLLYWLAGREKYRFFALCSCMTGFIIDLFLKSGGILGLLLGNRAYLLHVLVTMLPLYGLTFFVFYLLGKYFYKIR